MNEIIMALAIENMSLANENAELLKYVEALTEALERTSQRLAEAEDTTDERDKAIFKLAAATLKEKYDAAVKELVEEVQRLTLVNSCLENQTLALKNQRKKDIVTITELEEQLKDIRQLLTDANNDKKLLKELDDKHRRVINDLLEENDSLKRKVSEVKNQLQEKQNQNSPAPEAKKEATHIGYIDSLGYRWPRQRVIEKTYGLPKGSVSSYLAGRQDTLTVKDEWWLDKEAAKLKQTGGRIDIVRFDLDKFRSLPEYTRQEKTNVWAEHLYNHSWVAAQHGKEKANVFAPLPNTDM